MLVKVGQLKFNQSLIQFSYHLSESMHP